MPGYLTDVSRQERHRRGSRHPTTTVCRSIWLSQPSEHVSGWVSCVLVVCTIFSCSPNAGSVRKEVIQPHLPVQLPCYDFVPVTSPAFDGYPLAVSPPALGVTSSHDVTGGVYKARERIHRTIADARLLATPTSCGRVAAHNPNCDRLCRICSALRLGFPLYRPL